jgi:hypothetical protein
MRKSFPRISEKEIEAAAKAALLTEGGFYVEKNREGTDSTVFRSGHASAPYRLRAGASGFLQNPPVGCERNGT